MTIAQVSLPDYAAPLFEPARYKVLYGGRGAARSWTVARVLLIKSAKEPTRILCTRELQTSLRDSVMQLLKDQIELMGLTGYEVLKSEIRHANGSYFLFEGLRHNIKKIKSLEAIDICWVEEAESISAESWDVLIPTIRKPGSEIWVTFNPDQEDDATYKRFVVKPPQNAYIKFVNWHDNPWFEETELPAEKDYAYAVDPESADHVWGGETRKVSDAQILRGKWVIEPFQVPFTVNNNGSITYLWGGPYQGMDFGFASDPFASVRCWIKDRDLYIEHEVFKLHLELDDIPSTVCNAVPGFEDYVTRADSARPDSISFLKRYGLPRVEPVKKGPGSVEDGVAHLRSYARIVVHPSCKHTADECKRYSYKVDSRSGDILAEIVDAHNHCMDAIRYALQPMIKPRVRPGFLFANDVPKSAGVRFVAAASPEPSFQGSPQANGNGSGGGDGHDSLILRLQKMNR